MKGEGVSGGGSDMISFRCNFLCYFLGSGGRKFVNPLLREHGEGLSGPSLLAQQIWAPPGYGYNFPKNIYRRPHDTSN